MGTTKRARTKTRSSPAMKTSRTAIARKQANCLAGKMILFSTLINYFGRHDAVDKIDYKALQGPLKQEHGRQVEDQVH